MHKIAESPINTGFLRLYIYTFRYFEKEKQKINSLKLSGFQCDFIDDKRKCFFACNALNVIPRHCKQGTPRDTVYP